VNKLLEGKVALVTGAASGIGYEIARTFAREGAKVLLLDLNREAVEKAAEQLRGEGGEALGAGCDVTDEGQLKASIEKSVETFGRLDILVNNAGMQFVSPIEDFPTDTFEKLLSNMASINGLIGFAGKAAYNSAKHGVIGLTKVAALEGAAHGITVNALCPGYVDTPLVQNQLADLAKTRNVPLERVMEEVIYPLVPQRRLLSVQEIAEYAVFLASDKARGVTGQAVVIDGGYTAQ